MVSFEKPVGEGMLGSDISNTRELNDFIFKKYLLRNILDDLFLLRFKLVLLGH